MSEFDIMMNWKTYVKWYDCTSYRDFFHNIPASPKNALIYFLISHSWDSDCTSLYLLSVFISQTLALLLRKIEFQHGWSESRNGLLFLLLFLPIQYSFHAFSFAPSPHLNPGILFMITIFYTEWINFYIIWKAFKKGICTSLFLFFFFKEKKSRAWAKLYNGIFSLTLFFLSVIFVLLAITKLYDKSSNLNQFKPGFEIPFATPLCASEKKENERQIGIVTSVMFGCFTLPPPPPIDHHMHKRVLTDYFPFEGFEINL